MLRGAEQRGPGRAAAPQQQPPGTGTGTAGISTGITGITGIGTGTGVTVTGSTGTAGGAAAPPSGGEALPPPRTPPAPTDPHPAHPPACSPQPPQPPAPRWPGAAAVAPSGAPRPLLLPGGWCEQPRSRPYRGPGAALAAGRGPDEGTGSVEAGNPRPLQALSHTKTPHAVRAIFLFLGRQHKSVLSKMQGKRGATVLPGGKELKAIPHEVWGWQPQTHLGAGLSLIFSLLFLTLN